MTSAFSWQNSISLCPASFHIPRPYLPVTPGVSWLPTCAFQSPIMKRTSFLGVSSKSSCRSSPSHSTLNLSQHQGLFQWVSSSHQVAKLLEFQLQFFRITVWDIDLDYCDIEWFALEVNRNHLLIFEIAPKYCILDSCWLWGLLHFFYGILAHSSRYNGHLS